MEWSLIKHMDDFAFRCVTMRINLESLDVLLSPQNDTWDYQVFGLSPSSSILKSTTEHNVSETGSVSFLR
jgi:hypothetical protein